MAGGWAQDGAVSEQIEASINDELARMKAKARPTGTSLTHCAECEEPIPEARRAAGVGEGLIRVAVGAEDPADLIADLERGLAAAG